MNDVEFVPLTRESDEEESVSNVNNNFEGSIGNLRKASYDEAFDKAGFGLWQWLLLVQCGWANASDAIEIMCISFILSPIKDTMGVSYAELSGLTFAMFSGMMFGGYVWGSLADIRGRRSTVCVSLFVNSVFGALSALAKSYWLLLLLRFWSGFGAGGSLPACFTYFSEFQPTKYRGAMISALAMCWMIGNLIVGLVAFFVLPNSANVAAFSPYGDQWRLFVLLCSLPSFVSVLLFYMLPNSPKFLYSKNRLREALDVLKTVFHWNHLTQKHVNFGIDELHSQDQFHTDTEEMHRLLHERPSVQRKIAHNYSVPGQSRPTWKTFINNIKRCCLTWRIQMAQIFAPIRRKHSITIAISSVLIAFCGYGMAMWAPVLLNKTEKYGGSPCRGHTGNDSHTDGNGDGESVQMYTDILIGFVAQLPGNIIAILVMDRIGAKALLITCSFLSGLSVLFFWLVSSKTSVVVMNGIFNAISVGVWNGLDVILVEMYPTNIRSAATGMSAGISRLGSIAGTAVFGAFMDLDCGVPILTVFVLYSICGLLCFKLPNTRNIALR